MSLSVKSTPSEFKALSNEHRYDLVSLQKTPGGNATLAKSRKSSGFRKKCSKGGKGGSNGKGKHDGKQNPRKQKTEEVVEAVCEEARRHGIGKL